MAQSPLIRFSGIFVSYRRDDSSGHAGWLWEKLAAHFGKERIFMDIDTIEPGEDFVTVIEDAVGSCEILLAIIGRDWLSEPGKTTRRLDNPRDVVRLEIATALKRDIRVIPVLVQRADMPKPEDLPDDLAKFARRNAVELRDLRWQTDVDELIKVMERLLAKRAEATRLAEEEQRRIAAEAIQQAANEKRLEDEKQRKALEEKRRVEEIERQRRPLQEAKPTAEEKRVAEEVERQPQAREEANRAFEEKRVAEVSLNQASNVAQSVFNSDALPEVIQLPWWRSVTGSPRKLIGPIVGIAFVSIVFFIWIVKKSDDPQSSLNSSAARPPITSSPGSGEPPPNMVFVSGGDFVMGRDNGDDYERPAHRETLSPFFIDIYEVTCGDYEKFVRDDSHPAPQGWKSNSCPAGLARKPVTGVKWGSAVAFCHARGKRLPTEQEWEFAARGTDGRLYPWGNEWRPGLANADGVEDGMVDVGSYPNGKSPFGALDMVGNAWEWTAADMVAYPGGRLPDQPANDTKVLRGGTNGTSKERATTTYRLGWRASGESEYTRTGFRCVKDARQNTSAR